MKNAKLLQLASIILFFFYIFIMGYFFIQDALAQTKENYAPIGIDYAIYYSAGQFALNDVPCDSYNVPIHHQMLERVLNREVSFVAWWVYPPTFLLVVAPLALLPYPLSLAVWILATLVFAYFAIRVLLPKQKNLALLMLGFPGLLMNLRWGQNAFLSTGLLGFALTFLDTNPVLSGLMFGLLTYKPQLAAIILLILLISRQWRVLKWAALFASAFAFFAGLVFGFDVWLAFLNSSLHTTSSMMTDVWEQLSAIQPSLYSALRLLGITGPLSTILQLAVALCSVLAVRHVFKKSGNLFLKGSAIVLAIFLILPYFIQYDLMLLSIPIILLTADFYEQGCTFFEIAAVVLLFLLPLLNWPLVQFTGIQICPFVLMSLLIVTVRRASSSGLGGGDYGNQRNPEAKIKTL